MSSRKIEDCEVILQTSYLRAKEIFLAKYPDLPQPFLTCTYRSNEEQNALYAIGRTLPGSKVTNAKAGQSRHNSMPSKAFDIAFSLHGKLFWDAHLFQKFAVIIVPMGIDWGGSWKKGFVDKPHFQVG